MLSYSSRTFPVCSLCVKTDSTCEYPTYAEKPGPKLGECRHDYGFDPNNTAVPTHDDHVGSTQKNQRRRSQQKLLRPRPPQDPISTTTGSSESSTTATTPLAPTLSPLQTNFWSTPVGTATAVADDDMAEAESTAYPDGLAFCQIMYSSHHEHNKEQPLGSIDTLESSDLTIGVTLEAVCQSLRIPESIYHTL